MELQQKAEIIQGQMNEAKQQCGGPGLDGQMKSLTASIENLVKQRVQFHSQITQLEAQVEELKSSAVASCGRQMKHYQEEMTNIKQQMVDLAAKNAEPAQKADPRTKIAPLQTGQIPPRNRMRVQAGESIRICGCLRARRSDPVTNSN